MFAAALTLAGCATGTTIPSAEVAQAAVEQRFVGQPIHEAISRYGMPDGKMQVEGHDVYVWKYRTTMKFNKPRTAVTEGRMGASWDPNAIPYKQISTVQDTESLDLQCVLTIGTAIERPEIIDATALNGKMGACQAFMP